MQELQLASAAKTFDEASMERSKSFIKALQLSNYSSTTGVLYCKPHFEQLFKETDIEQLFKKNGSFLKN
ncbi:hypothetical protein Sjap_008182 [Stephania japonica]|uniref:Uncharacterized protein n=1 Tax=Stephania japonica TaxID=461633 RepID=A0AAP0PAL4_9MAGN